MLTIALEWHPTYAAKFINKHMILGVRIIQKGVDGHQRVTMYLIINHSLQGVTEHLHCNRIIKEEDTGLEDSGAVQQLPSHQNETLESKGNPPYRPHL